MSTLKKLLAIWVLMWVLLSAIHLTTGCSTVTPVKVVNTTPSMDGNAANSGFIGFTETGYGIITPHARERFNALIETYGSKFTTPIKADVGILPMPNGNYLITKESLAKFSTMNRWRKEGVK